MTVLSDEEIQRQLNNEENTKRRYITPVISAKWDSEGIIIMEHYFTDGQISIDEFNNAHRGRAKKADYLLLYKGNILLAIVEAKARDLSADDGYSQAVEYAAILDVPFAYSTNGDDLIERDMIAGINKEMKIADFPGPEELWERYIKEKNYTSEEEAIISYPYYTTSNGKKPRYYQRIAINRTVESIAKGKKRILIVMATGTGKTFTAFQIIYRFWKTRSKKKVLYIADRNILVDQTIQKDFRPFGDAMEKINNKNINATKDIYLGLYQQLKTSTHEYYKQLPRDFFDIIIVDECHRGSADADSSWHDILTYFSPAIQIGMTATPKDGGLEAALVNEKEAMEHYDYLLKNGGSPDEIKKARNAYVKATETRFKLEEASNINYFGNPIYTYSLKQGIEDGFLAPYKVLSVDIDIDKTGWRPKKGMKDVHGNPVEDRVYTQQEFDRKIVVEERRKIIAKRISDYLKTNDMRFSKTIVFCENIPHCQEMVRLLENENSDLVREDRRYIMQITGDNPVGKAQLDNFVDPYSKYPVIVVTSKLMSTGVDAETCDNVVLDRTIGSMTEFKQIIGRGTRIKEEYEIDGVKKSKMYFTILDFRKNYLKFNDPDFDGNPITVVEVPDGHDFPKPPIRPTPPPAPTPPVTPTRIVRVRGVDVNIVGEDVRYYDASGNLVTQNLSSCIRNNVLLQYPVFDDFKKAWLLNNDKSRFGFELLLETDWEENYKTRYGYEVDMFDIIGSIVYGIDPPASKHQRVLNPHIAIYLSQFGEVKKEVIRKLLNAYILGSFDSLKDVKNIFAQKEFLDMGFTPIKIIRDVFGTKDNYFAMLKELENKLYE